MRIESTERIKNLPLKKKIIKLIGRGTFWFFFKATGLLRPWSVGIFGSMLGTAFYNASARYRKIAIKNLSAVYKDEKSEAEIKSIAKQVFIHFTRAALEFFYVISLNREQIDNLVDFEGYEHIDKALAGGKGCIVITAHYGNWELFARKLVIHGYKMNVIARDSDDPGITGITTRIRESGGYRVFDKDQPIIGAFRSLKNNECLGILPDQNESTGVFVDFFSRPTATATGPAVMSIKSGAAIVPGFATRQPDGRYKAIAYPRIDFTPSGDETKDIRDLTALINLAIERQIRENPSQWLWLHDRWKLSPKVVKNAG